MAPKTPVPEGDDKIPVLTLPNRGEDEPGTEPEPNPELVAMQATNTALEAQIADGRAREERMERMQEQMMMRPAAQAPAMAAPVAPPPVAFEGMPDPVVEPEKFAAEMMSRTATAAAQAADAAAAARIAPAASAMDVQQKLNDMKSKFAANFPDLADYGDMVDAEIVRRAKDAGARGMDIEGMMFANPDNFVKDVGTSVTARIASIRGPGKKPEEGDGEPAEGRDTEVAGGDAGIGGKPAKKAGAEAPDFMAQLRKSQRDSGFF